MLFKISKLTIHFFFTKYSFFGPCEKFMVSVVPNILAVYKRGQLVYAVYIVLQLTVDPQQMVSCNGVQTLPEYVTIITWPVTSRGAYNKTWWLCDGHTSRAF